MAHYGQQYSALWSAVQYNECTVVGSTVLCAIVNSTVEYNVVSNIKKNIKI